MLLKRNAEGKFHRLPDILARSPQRDKICIRESRETCQRKPGFRIQRAGIRIQGAVARNFTRSGRSKQNPVRRADGSLDWICFANRGGVQPPAGSSPGGSHTIRENCSSVRSMINRWSLESFAPLRLAPRNVQPSNDDLLMSEFDKSA